MPVPFDLTIPRLDDAAIVVDGRADEAAWAGALTVDGLTTYAPSDEVETPGRLVARILADDRGVYVHFRVEDEAAAVRANVGRRDSRYADDRVGLFWDPTGEGQRAFWFQVNPLGVQIDQVHAAPQGTDDSWDAIWWSAASRTEFGWEAEIAVPWSALRTPRHPERVGLAINRHVARRGHDQAWPPVMPQGEILVYEALVGGPGEVPRSLGLELMPEVTWQVGRNGDQVLESKRWNVGGVAPGFSVRYTPVPSLAIAGTVNPDYSQLESDAAVIDANLRYPASYPEKRRFFLEGQEWFSHPFRDIVYSRSMVEPLYGVRGTWEVRRWTLAGLHVLDAAPDNLRTEGEAFENREFKDHMALETVARARLGLAGDGFAGVLVSDRTMVDSALYSRLAGVDLLLRLTPATAMEAALLGSTSTLAEGEDPVNASAARWWLRHTGKRAFFSLRTEAIAPGFRAANGDLPQEDLIGGLAEGHVNLYPGGALPRLALEPLDVLAAARFDGSVREVYWDPSAWLVFGNGTFLKLDLHLGEEALGDELVEAVNAEVYASGTATRFVQFGGGALAGTSPYYADPASPRAGRLALAYADAIFTPLPRWNLALSPSWQRMAERSGPLLFNAWTLRLKTELYLTRALWLRAVADRRLQVHTVEELSANEWRLEGLGAFEWVPGRAVYVGGAIGSETQDYWQIFAKASWVFQL